MRIDKSLKILVNKRYSKFPGFDHIPATALLVISQSGELTVCHFSVCIIKDKLIEELYPVSIIILRHTTITLTV